MFEVGSSTGINNPLPPVGGTPGTQSTSTTQPVSRDDSFTQIGGIVGSAAAGGAASYKFSATFSNSLKNTISDVKTTEGGMNKVKAALPELKTMGMTTLKAGGVGAIISGAISAVSNGVDVLRGKKTGSEAVGTFAADTANGTIGAMAGVATGGLATFALSSMLGATPLMIVGVGVGALGAVLSDRLFKGSGAYDAIRNGVMGVTSQK